MPKNSKTPYSKRMPTVPRGPVSASTARANAAKREIARPGEASRSSASAYVGDNSAERAAQGRHAVSSKTGPVMRPAATRAATVRPTPRSATASTLPADLHKPVFSGWRLWSLILAIISVSCFIAAIVVTSATNEVEEDRRPIEGLPSYVTHEMVRSAIDAQEHYGHPAGATLAQIIAESGQGSHLSELAMRDHNLFGMKWSEVFEGEPEIEGSDVWQTEEEYDTGRHTIHGAFVKFKSDVDCIQFRSRFFLQPSRYSQNEYILRAIENRDSRAMAMGLEDAGWATADDYAEGLIALIDKYKLDRFDNISLEEFDKTYK